MRSARLASHNCKRDALTKMSMFSKGWINYTYDAQGRLFTRNIADLLNESYAYLTNPNNSTRTTTWISGKTILAPNGTSLKNFLYDYNSLGYITTERESRSGIKLHYTYDAQGQLLTATKSVNDTPQKTYTYTYDTYGNLRTATDGTTSHTYTYGDSNWADLLTAYDSTALTYDASGNPTSYYNGASYTMQWRNGRELQNLTKGGKKTSYEYDVDGLRTLKTNTDGSYSVYYWLGNLLLAEERRTGNTTRVLVFSYDENNSPIGFQFKTNNGPWYYYLYAKNIQGDIVALYRRDIDSNGNKVATHIANYEYDPWGKIISIKNAAGQDLSGIPDNSANINPLRYRGYYYDNESGFYYLQSRYYDPSIGRFINADNYSSTGQDFLGYNMFAYCGNNPIVREDGNGKFWNFIVGAVVGAVVNAVTTVVDAVKEDGWDALSDGKTWAKVGVSAATGAINGAVAASGLGMFAQAGISAVTSGLGDAAIQYIDTGHIDVKETIQSSLVAGGTSLAGSLAGNYVGKHITKTSVKADNAFDKHLYKTFTASQRSSAGKSSSKLLRQAARYMAKTKYYDNVTRGVTSVVGSFISSLF